CGERQEPMTARPEAASPEQITADAPRTPRTAQTDFQLGVRQPAPAALTRKRRWPLVAALLLALLILAGGAFLIVRLLQRSSSSGLELVPGDAAAFLSVRVADVWNKQVPEETRELFSEDIDKALQAACGLQLADLERVTIVLPTLPVNDRTQFW